MAKRKYKSRAARMMDAMAQYENALGELEEIQADIDSEGRAEPTEEETTRVVEIIDSLDYGEIECLKEELESWKEGMEGTNLEQTSKYETLDESVQILESIVEVFSSLDSGDELESTIQYLQEGVGDAENVEFPGMFG